MWATVSSFFAGMFSSSRLQDTAIDGLRKLGGLDEMNGKEKAQFILDYMNATKHQSIVRRLIALVMVGLFTAFVLTWLIAAGAGYYFDIQTSLEFAGAVKMFFESVILQPYNLILSFYFIVNIAQKVGGK